MNPEEILNNLFDANHRQPDRFSWYFYGKETLDVNNSRVEFFCNKELLESLLFDARATKIEPKPIIQKLQ